MKHVWILNHYAQTPDNVGSTRHFHLAKYIKSKNWDATIIASSTNHHGQRQRFTSHDLCYCKKNDKVSFVWIRTPEYVGNGLGRVVNMLVYTFIVLKKQTLSKLRHPDVIIGSSVHPFAALAASLLAKRYKVPFVFEVRDLWPQTLVDMGKLKESSVITYFLRKLELSLYKQASKIIVLMPDAYKYIVPLGIPEERIVWIPNGVDLSLYPSSYEVEEELKNEFTLMYFGSVGQANGLDDILMAMKNIQDETEERKIKLRIIGDGPMKKKLITLSESLDLENVIFEPPVMKCKIPILAKEADAFVISVLDLPNLYRYGISMNKIFDYLAAGRPIIIATNASNNPVDDANAGITVPPGDSKAFSKAILEMLCMPIQKREEMGKNGRAYVEKKHGYDILAEKLSAILNEVYSDDLYL